MAARSLEQLSSTIAQNVATISRSLQDQGTPSPTIQDIDGPNLKNVNEAAAAELANAAHELQALAQGPGQQLSLLAFACHDVSSVGTLLEFNIPGLVPLDAPISLGELAVKSGLLEDKLARIIRYATTNFIFYEPSPGHVAHTAVSAMLAREPQFATFLRLVLVDLAPIAVALPHALLKWPQSEAPTHSGVNAAFRTEEPFFKWLSRDAGRQARFDEGMAGFSSAGTVAGDRPQTVDVAAYPWGKVLPPDGHVVDVGGGSGHVSRALAESFPSFRITVQDRAEVIEAARQDASGKRGGNVSYQVHSFFEPQPLIGADVYFLRQIMHDWPRREAVSILRALVPALKPGARVLVSEYVVPPPEDLGGPGRFLETKLVREMDLQMMAIFNSKERTKDEFAALFSEADPRLRFCGAYQVPEDRKSCIFEAIWEP
ncbi:S-adenosyl-L-methionine-dependent methyltransferase [Hypoxylon crocopeplum]|nr:S-adenosyl-L-methionine-dependent methyltransferase [Hypoxylon crocopeplum]